MSRIDYFIRSDPYIRQEMVASKVNDYFHV